MCFRERDGRLSRPAADVDDGSFRFRRPVVSFDGEFEVVCRGGIHSAHQIPPPLTPTLHPRLREEVPNRQLRPIRQAPRTVLRLLALAPPLLRLDGLGAGGERLQEGVVEPGADVEVRDEGGGEGGVGDFVGGGGVEEAVGHGVMEEAAEMGFGEVADVGETGVGDAADEGDGFRDAEVEKVAEGGEVVVLFHGWTVNLTPFQHCRARGWV